MAKPGNAMGRAVLLAGLMAASALAPLAAAESSGLMVWFHWPRSDLQVLVLPPPHGPVLNVEGRAVQVDPETYVRATRDALADWRAAIGVRIAEVPHHAWLRDLRWDAIELAHASPDALRLAAESADIVMGFDESKATYLGLAVNLVAPWESMPVDVPAPPAWPAGACVASVSMWYFRSFTYADLYNVFTHEFGHCLGLYHAKEPRDVMYAVYEHQVGYMQMLSCPSNLDAEALTYTFGAALGHPPPAGEPRVPVWQRYMLRENCI